MTLAKKSKANRPLPFGPKKPQKKISPRNFIQVILKPISCCNFMKKEKPRKILSVNFS